MLQWGIKESLSYKPLEVTAFYGKLNGKGHVGGGGVVVNSMGFFSSGN